jgi:hypothetical protein
VIKTNGDYVGTNGLAALGTRQARKNFGRCRRVDASFDCVHRGTARRAPIPADGPENLAPNGTGVITCTAVYLSWLAILDAASCERIFGCFQS